MFESVQKRAAVIARDGLKVRRLVVSCRKLLSERGEAAGVSLATITLDLYRSLDKKDQARLFATLLAEFSPDPAAVLAAATAYAAEPSAVTLAQLSIAAEPPRQELLRRLNRAPGGTAAMTSHHGAYSGLGDANAAILAWCRAQGRVRAGPSWEVYGHWHADPAQLRTDVYYLLQPTGATRS